MPTSTRTPSARRESRYRERPVSASQADLPRDGSGDVVDEDDEVDAEFRETRNVTRPRGSDEEEEQEGSQDGAVDDDADEPGPQPLTTDALPILRAQSGMYSGANLNAEKVRAFIVDAASIMAEVKEGVDEKGQELDGAYRSILDLEEESRIRRQIFEDVLQKIAHGQEEITDVVSLYKDTLEEKMKTYRSKTSRQKYSSHSGYIALKEQVWEAYNSTAMPPMIDQIPIEQGDEDDDEDDFAVGGTLMDFKCPITMAILEDPVTSKTCNHSYSKIPIQQVLSTGRGRTQCPKAGCDKIITSATLFDDKNLAKRIAGYKRRLETRTQSRRTQTTVID